MNILHIVMILQTLFAATKGFYISTRLLRTSNYNFLKMNPNSAAKKLMPPPKMNADASTDSSLKAPKRIRLRHKRKDSTPAKVAQVSQNVAMDVALNNPNPIPLSSSSESSVAMSVQCHNLDVDADDSEIASNASNEFNDLDISANTKKAIVTQLKYKTMTPVQTASIPVILEGKDVVVKGKLIMKCLYVCK